MHTDMCARGRAGQVGESWVPGETHWLKERRTEQQADTRAQADVWKDKRGDKSRSVWAQGICIPEMKLQGETLRRIQLQRLKKKTFVYLCHVLVTERGRRRCFFLAVSKQIVTRCVSNNILKRLDSAALSESSDWSWWVPTTITTTASKSNY